MIALVGQIWSGPPGNICRVEFQQPRKRKSKSETPESPWQRQPVSLSPGLEEHLSGSGLERPPIMPAMIMIMLKMIMVRKDRDVDDMLISCGH